MRETPFEMNMLVGIFSLLEHTPRYDTEDVRRRDSKSEYDILSLVSNDKFVKSIESNDKRLSV